MILKNIWSNRRKNAWVFVELILVTLLSWSFVDLYLTAAYADILYEVKNEADRDQLVLGYLAYEDEPEDVEASKRALLNAMREMPQVESASLGSLYHIVTSPFYGSLSFPSDSNICAHAKQYFMDKGNDIMTTLGIRMADGSNADTVLNRMMPEDIMITRDLAMALYGTEDVVGRQIVTNYKLTEQAYGLTFSTGRETRTIRGVTNNIMTPTERYAYAFFTYQPMPADSYTLIIRLKEGVDPVTFADEFNNTNEEERLHHNTMYVYNIDAYVNTSYKNGQQLERSVFDQITLILLFVFALNIFIGTIGTYWIQIRRRDEEINILRSFGASRRRIVAMLIGEGALLTLAAWVIACIIRLQFPKESLYGDSVTCYTGNEIDIVTEFWPHFLIISAAVYILVYLIVVLAILIPSIHLTKRLRIEN